MIAGFTKNRDLKTRRNVLDGVYEENCVILGGGRTALARRTSLPLKRIILAVVVAVFVALMYGTGTWFSRTEMSAARETHHAGDGSLVGEMTAPAETVPALGIAAALASSLPPSSQGYVSSQGMMNHSESIVLGKSSNVHLSRMLGLTIRTIMIDPGHGGTDFGARGKMGTLEKDITLDIAKRLKAHLLGSGLVNVLMTREADAFVPLQKRVSLTREAKADLFISIHLNSLPCESCEPMNFIETYYFGPSDSRRTLNLAMEENAGSEYGLSDFSDITEELGKTMKVQESQELANCLQTKLFQNRNKDSREVQNHGVKRAPFVVLLGVDVPGALVEVSSLSNLEEEQELTLEKHRENIATYLASGIFNYLEKGALIHETKR